STSLASLPRPLSFACAVSIPVRRPRPLVIDPASAPPAATPTPATPALSVLPMPLEILEPIELPTSEPYPEAPPSAFLIPGATLLVSATILMCPTANSAMIYPRRIVKLGRGKTQPFVHLFDRNRVHLESVSAAKQCGAIVSCRLLRCGRHTRPRGRRRLLAFAPAALKGSSVTRIKHASQKMRINSPKSRLAQLATRNSGRLIGLQNHDLNITPIKPIRAIAKPTQPKPNLNKFSLNRAAKLRIFQSLKKA